MKNDQVKLVFCVVLFLTIRLAGANHACKSDLIAGHTWDIKPYMEFITSKKKDEEVKDQLLVGQACEFKSNKLGYLKDNKRIDLVLDQKKLYMPLYQAKGSNGSYGGSADQYNNAGLNPSKNRTLNLNDELSDLVYDEDKQMYICKNFRKFTEVRPFAGGVSFFE